MEALRGHDGAVIFKPIPPEAFTVVRGRTGSARMASNVKVDTSKYRREVTEDAEDLARRSFDRQEENRGHEYDTDDLADRAEALLGDTKDVRQFRRMPDAIKSVYDLEGVLTTKIRELTDVGDYDAGDDVMALIRELMDYEDTLEERRTLDEWLEQTREWTREPMEGTERIAANLAKAMADAIGRIDPWNGSKVLITAQVPRDFQFGDVEHRPATAYYVKVGGDDAGFSVFTDKAGKIEHIDDVLEAGDTDFFRDPRDQMDYFNLVRELRHPGSTQRAGKDIVLWTARPVKDRRLYERARTVPPNIFLTTDPDRAYGIARDLGGGAQRDLWRMVINERHLMKTLDAGRTKDYQTIGDKPVPVKRVELVSEGQGKVARLARVAARYLEGHR